MENIKFDYSKSFIKDHEIKAMEDYLELAHNQLNEGKGLGSEFTDWINLPVDYDKEEYDRIKKASSRIRENSDILLVIGIGGSYLGARACIEALSHSFQAYLPEEKRDNPHVLYVGNNISSTYMSQLFDILDGKDFSINVISKSGTTTEPALAFRIFKEYLEERYGREEAKERIYVTTDKEKGALRTLVNEEGYESFIIPDGVGGRFSVLTAVGLLPISVAGVDIDQLMDGARDGVEEYNSLDLDKNIAYQYALCRNILNRKGKDIEILANYEPSLNYLSEWWKQLYGESEGKDGKGIFPASVSFTTDLHSMGQWIQDGKRNIFETVLNIEKPLEDMEVKEDKENLDGLNYLVGKSIDEINKKAMEGTIMAHVDGNVPNLLISLPELNEYYLGKLIYMFEKACAISGYVLGVNPFDQEGVEAYKSNMFKLLGKPGY